MVYEGKGIFPPTRDAGQIHRSNLARQRNRGGRPNGARDTSPRRKKSPILDAFAEHLANGLTPGDAAVAIGKPRKAGGTYLHSIRKRLGPQAV